MELPLSPTIAILFHLENTKISNPKKKALVIAVSDYDEDDLAELDFCKKDGEQMINVLKSQKYEIATKQNAIGKVEGAYMKNKIYEFFGDPGINRNDTVLFYYSGHGVVSRSGEVHLTSSNIDPKSPNKLGFSFSELTNVMNDCISQRVVSILDCCYSGGAKVSKGDEDSLVSKATSIIESKSKNLREGVGKVLLTASLGSQEAYPTKRGDHSFFTYYLLEALKGADGKSVNNDGTVTPSSLIEYIQAEIDKLPTKEKPYQNPLWKGEITGKIILAIHEEFRQKQESDLDRLTKPLIEKSNYFQKEGKYEKAIKCCDEAIKIDPNDAYVWYNKGYCLSWQDKYDEAIKCCDEAIRLDPRLSLAWNNKGFCLAMQGKYKDGLKCYEEAIKIEPNYAEPWYNKGYCLGNLGKYKDAIKCCDEAIRLDPNYAMAWNNKGWCLSLIGKYDEAIKCCDEAIRLDPRLSLAWYNKGYCLGNLGKYDEAISCYDKVLEIDPKNVNALDNKNMLVDKQKKNSENK